jgi:hypothetical protein
MKLAPVAVAELESGGRLKNQVATWILHKGYLGVSPGGPRYGDRRVGLELICSVQCVRRHVQGPKDSHT